MSQEQSTQRLSWGVYATGAIVIVTLLLVIGLHPGPASPVQQILNRYADQVRAGQGLVFNPGERALLAPAPAYLLVLAVLSLLMPTLTASAILLTASGMIGAYSLRRIALRAGFSEMLVLLSALIFSCATLFLYYMNPTLATAAGLCLVALDLSLSERWTLAGAFLALAVLCHLLAVTLILPLLLIAGSKNATGRFLIPALSLLLLAGIALRLYYGPDWLAGLLLLNFDFPADGRLWICWLLVIALVGYSWTKQRPTGPAAVCGTWIALYLFIAGLLLRISPGWLDLLVVGPLLVTFFAAVKVVAPRLAILGGGLVAILSALALTLLWAGTVQPGFPLQNLSDVGVIGVESVDDGLAHQPALNQTLITFDGHLQPELKHMIERGDIQSALIRYAPDVLFTRSGGRIDPAALSSGAWARLAYRQGDSSGSFVRQSQIGTFKDYAAHAAYGPDILLAGFALDQTSLRPGQLLRVRLDWQFSRAASKPVTIDLWLRSGDYLLAHATDTFEPAIFQPGAWSTYHTLTVLDRAWAGPVTLESAVIVSDGTIGRVPLTTLSIASGS